MDQNIKKNLASNWFKTLQHALCDDILKIEKNKIHQNRWFFIFLVWLGIGKKGNAVGFGQNGSLIR